MSEPVAKRRPMIDLEEFERRLGRPPALNQEEFLLPRAEAPRAGNRLISGDFAAIEAGLLRGRGAGAAPNLLREAPSSGEGLIGGDFSSIRAGLLDAVAREDGTRQAGPSVGAGPEHPRYAGQTTMSSSVDEDVRSPFPLYVMAAVIVVGIAGVAASLGSAGRFTNDGSSAPGGAVIDAATAPSEQRFDAANSADVPTRSEGVFDRARGPETRESEGDLGRTDDMASGAERPAARTPAVDLAGGSPAVADRGPTLEGVGALSPRAGAEPSGIEALIAPQQMYTVSTPPAGPLPGRAAPAHDAQPPLPAPRPAIIDSAGKTPLQGKAAQVKPSHVKASQPKTPEAKAPEAKAPVHAAAAKPGAAAESGGHRQPAAPARPAAAPARVADAPAAKVAPPIAQPNPAPDGALGFVQNALSSVAGATDKLLEWGGLGGARP